MPDRRKTLTYKAVPRRRPGLRPILWMTIGFSVLALIGSGWSMLLLSGRMSSHHSFVGRLSPAFDLATVALPEGAILKTVHVPTNTEVRKGQTVATLDIEAMERHVKMLSAELLHDDMLRQCLLLEDLPEAAFFVDLPDYAQDQARLARQACQGILAEKQLIRTRLTEEQSLVQEEQNLIKQYQTRLSQGLQRPLPPEQREADSKQALALALLHNKLDQQLAQIQFAADQDEAVWENKRLERVKTLMDAIRLKTELRHHMRALLRQPRLQAPETGTVVQVRNITSTAPMKTDVDLIVVRPQAGLGYRASFEIPEPLLEVVKMGHKVQMKMLGLSTSSPLLRGKVSRLQRTNHATVRAHITLDRDSIAHLDDPDLGLALRGFDTASIIQVQKADQDALSLFEDILTHGVLQSGKQGFLSRLMSSLTTTDPTKEVL